MARGRVLILLALAGLPALPAAAAVCGNGIIEAVEQCDDGAQNGSLNSCCASDCTFTSKRPDVIVGSLSGVSRLGSLGGYTAYSVDTVSCNLGSCWLNWINSTPAHPVIAQNMFRLKDGRFEQLGQSWVKHGFAALAENVCGSCVPPPDGNHLGVRCSDPYDGGLNGVQGLMGPRSSVNPATGAFPYPDPAIQTTGNVLFKRLHVSNADLDPALNPGALYFVEGQYVTRDDAAAGKQNNNASYRKVLVGGAPSYNVSLDGPTWQQRPAILAWQDTDQTVLVSQLQADGLFLVASKVTSLGGALYHYEYAVQNLTSHRGARSFTVRFPPGTQLSNMGFHDVDSHSGEPYDLTDWSVEINSTSATWSTWDYEVAENANALRWGTLYNFRFDADVGPGLGGVSLGLFRPGPFDLVNGSSPTAVGVITHAPGPCTQAPEVMDDSLRLSRAGGRTTVLTWTPAMESAWSIVLRGWVSALPVGPGGSEEVCLGPAFDGTLSDEEDPIPNNGYWYLVQGRNACGQGSWGHGRVTGSCP